MTRGSENSEHTSKHIWKVYIFQNAHIDKLNKKVYIDSINAEKRQFKDFIKTYLKSVKKSRQKDSNKTELSH